MLVFVHGFQGRAEETFGRYPERLQHLVLETHPCLQVEAVIYPTYETRGSLGDAVDALVAWLTTLVAEYESTHRRRFGVVLCGHSMGGLVCLDAARAIRSQGEDAWPRVCGVVAYDTPFLGVHPHVFKHQLSTYQQYVDTAVKASSVWAPLSGGLAAWWSAPPSRAPTRLSTATWIGVGAAAATAIGTAASAAVHRSDAIQDAYRWVREHLLFVRHLWDREALASRITDCDVPFHCFYTLLAGEQRPFILVPPPDAPYAPHFSPLTSHAKDEVAAHTSMFALSTNPSYLAMGLASASLISGWTSPGASRAARLVDDDEHVA